MSNKLAFNLKRIAFGTKYEILRVATIPYATAYVLIRRAGKSIQMGWPIDHVDNKRQDKAFDIFRKSLAELHISQFAEADEDGNLRQILIPTPQSVKHELLDTKVENLGICLFPNNNVKIGQADKWVKVSHEAKRVELI